MKKEGLVCLMPLSLRPAKGNISQNKVLFVAFDLTHSKFKMASDSVGEARSKITRYKNPFGHWGMIGTRHVYHIVTKRDLQLEQIL